MKRTAEQTFEKIYELLKNRLDVLGNIKSGEAWEICRIYFGYSTICREFRKIMGLMIEQKKAIKVGYGIWKILKPNRKKPECKCDETEQIEGIIICKTCGKSLGGAM